MYRSVNIWVLLAISWGSILPLPLSRRRAPRGPGRSSTGRPSPASCRRPPGRQRGLVELLDGVAQGGGGHGHEAGETHGPEDAGQVGGEVLEDKLEQEGVALGGVAVDKRRGEFLELLRRGCSTLVSTLALRRPRPSMSRRTTSRLSRVEAAWASMSAR